MPVVRHIGGVELWLKVKCNVVQVMRLCTGRKANRGNRGIDLLFLHPALEGGEGSAALPGRTLPRVKTRYQLYRRMGGPQGRSGEVREISPHRDSIPDRPARSSLTSPTQLPVPLFF